jgi:hypothetical protein
MADSGLTAIDPRTGALLKMSEEAALDYIERGLVVPIGPLRCISELHWVGTAVIENITTPEEAAAYRASRSQKLNTKYFYDFETRENPPDVFALFRQDGNRKIFLAVAASCRAPFRDPASQQ